MENVYDGTRGNGYQPLTEGKTRHAPKLNRGVEPMMPPPPPTTHIARSDGRFCVNCDNILPDNRCSAFEPYTSEPNKVTGYFYVAHYQCDELHKSSGRCGPEAKFWKPAPMPVPVRHSWFSNVIEELRLVFS